MSYAWGIALTVFAVAIVVGALTQVSLYRRGLHIITPVQLALRLITAGLLLLVIAMAFWGSVHQWPSPAQALVYWSGLIVAVMLAVVLALVDLRQVWFTRDSREAQLYVELARDAARLPHKKSKDASPDGPGNAE